MNVSVGSDVSWCRPRTSASSTPHRRAIESQLCSNCSRSAGSDAPSSAASRASPAIVGVTPPAPTIGNIGCETIRGIPRYCAGDERPRGLTVTNQDVDIVGVQLRDQTLGLPLR